MCYLFICCVLLSQALLVTLFSQTLLTKFYLLLRESIWLMSTLLFWLLLFTDLHDCILLVTVMQSCKSLTQYIVILYCVCVWLFCVCLTGLKWSCAVFYVCDSVYCQEKCSCLVMLSVWRPLFIVVEVTVTDYWSVCYSLKCLWNGTFHTDPQYKSYILLILYLFLEMQPLSCMCVFIFLTVEAVYLYLWYKSVCCEDLYNYDIHCFVYDLGLSSWPISLLLCMKYNDDHSFYYWWPLHDRLHLWCREPSGILSPPSLFLMEKCVPCVIWLMPAGDSVAYLWKAFLTVTISFSYVQSDVLMILHVVTFHYRLCVVTWATTVSVTCITVTCHFVLCLSWLSVVALSLLYSCVSCVFCVIHVCSALCVLTRLPISLMTVCDDCLIFITVFRGILWPLWSLYVDSSVLLICSMVVLYSIADLST